MSVFDITPSHKIVPSSCFWGKSAPNLAVSEQNTLNIESLRDLEKYYKVRIRLDSININETKWTTELLQKITKASYPLRGLLTKNTTVKITKEWLVFWEIFSICLIPGLISRMQKRIEGVKTRARSRARERKEDYEDKNVTLRGVLLRTFHLLDNHSSSISTMQKAINKVEYETSVQINWDWLATYSNEISNSDLAEIAKNRGNWLAGVDGEGGLSVPNMRAWKNKISTALKVADIIIVNNSNEEDVVNGIAFSLINLGAGGAAIIYIPRVASASMVSMIHLFTQCFERSAIVHTAAEDKMFLCGEHFLNNITSKHAKLLYDYCDLEPGHTNQSPFTLDYIGRSEFQDTLDALTNVNTAIQSWRYEYYEKVLVLNAELIKSTSARTFDKYVESVAESHYKDESDKWVEETSFNFFA